MRLPRTKIRPIAMNQHSMRNCAFLLAFLLGSSFSTAVAAKSNEDLPATLSHSWRTPHAEVPWSSPSSDSSHRNVQSTTTLCTVAEFVMDDCLLDADGVCDAGGFVCTGNNTDCFDCDPCQANAGRGCEACVAVPGCQYCSVPSQGINGVCSSDVIASLVPNICRNTAVDGTGYAATCTETDTTPIGTSTGICNVETDTCPLQLNGKCEANGFTCEFDSDCFDCDPCLAYRFDGCDACVAAGCLWCQQDAVCLSPDAQFLPSLFRCAGETDFVSTCPTTDTSTLAFADPFYESQLWLYEQINVLPVWAAGITGTGIGIRVNDDGVDYTHDEFAGKFSVDGSCSVYAPVSLDASHSHGTTCASLAAGNGGPNSPCAVGVAPGATLSACRVVPENPPRLDTAVASEAADFSFLYDNMETMHVSSNSYGIDPCQRIPTPERRRRLQECPFTYNATTSPCVAAPCANADWSTSFSSSVSTTSTTNSTCESYIAVYCRVLFERDVEACTAFLDLSVQCEYNSQAPEQLDAMKRGVTEGRDGKGIVYVFASGNTFSAGTDVNFEGALNSRYTISVGAVGKDGTHASYSIAGAPLFLSAPGGDFDTYTNNIVALAGGGCADGGIGTSFSAPIVSGVVALILEVNLDLSWRDVQGILAQTSKQVKPDDPSWTVNSAGFHHSYLYGFGLVDADAAVTAARTWTLFPPELQIIVNSEAIDLNIPDFQVGTPASSTVTVDTIDTFVVESVIVFLDLVHSTRGDLEIVLTSPSGTASILAPGQRPENSQSLEAWKLMTVRKWGESAIGDWTLSLVDQSTGDLSSCVDEAGWSVTFGRIDPIELDCGIFRRAEICVDGQEGPGFASLFSTFATSLQDSIFTDELGVSVVDACCVCGGGVDATSLNDVLRSWTLAVYGRDGSLSSDGGPAPTTLVTPTTTNDAPPMSSPTLSIPPTTPATQPNIPPPPTPAATNQPNGTNQSNGTNPSPPVSSPSIRIEPTSGVFSNVGTLLGWRAFVFVALVLAALE